MAERAGLLGPLLADEVTWADVTIDAGGTFTARLLVPGPVVDGAEVTAFAGRWAVGRGLMAAAITLHRPPAG